MKHLVRHLPRDGFGNYWEPFVGSGALFFAIAPKKSYLSDSIEELIDCYRYIKVNPNLVNRYLRYHLSKTSRKYYYAIREQFNESASSAAQAARFIYLNRTSFNGIYRVNRFGGYNVPYGHKEPPPMPSLGELRFASKLLQKATLRATPYNQLDLEHRTSSGDFIYLDPPYPPLNEATAYFRHYTDSRFSWSDHQQLSNLANTLRKMGCKIMVSNYDNEDIRKLYRGWNFHPLPVMRFIAANGSRKSVPELVITSY